jgi:short-subunit dehydrogenase
LRGSHALTAYSASKAFISNYMEGLRLRFAKKKINITVTDIRPGYVDTPMTKGNKGMFWIASSQKAARQIFKAIEAKKDVAYITRRWAIVAFFLKILPAFMLKK